MGKYIELIGQLKPKNNGNFPIADVNDLRGGYIQLEEYIELSSLPEEKLREGMLAYVDQTGHIYQYKKRFWNLWNGGGGGGGASILRVGSLADLETLDVRIPGQIVFVEDIKDIRFFDGEFWLSFNKIYIQATEPEDKGGIWIDTSEEREFLHYDQAEDDKKPEGIITNLLQVISVLESKMRKLEWALGNQLDFGDFKNNHYSEYDNYPDPQKPNYGTDEEEDDATAESNLNRGVEDVEPIQYKDIIPNGRHLCIKGGTYQQMLDNAGSFLPKELLWVEDRKQLWIKDSLTNKLIQIGSYGGGEPTPGPDDEKMEQIITETIGNKEKIFGINFGDMANKSRDYDYQLRVVNGKIVLYDLSLETNILQRSTQELAAGEYYKTIYIPVPTPNSISPMIYINSVYTGGKGTQNSYNPCSHNFIEISNLTKEEINLKGLYLHYTNSSEKGWVTLPLIGKVKPSGTFLVRGSQCSIIDVNTTLIKVSTYDMEWTKEATINPLTLDTPDGETIWGADGKLQFSTDCSFYISSKEPDRSFETTPLEPISPWSNKTVLKWYVDLVGIGKDPNSTTALPNEASAYPVKGSNILLHRYLSMDFVKQAIKAVGARSNAKQWTHIDLDNLNERINIEEYRPRASFEDKGVFYNKNLLKEGAPNIVTCSFGRNAHTTRCFNWMSKGYYDEYIWFADESGNYVEGEQYYESFKPGMSEEQRPNKNNWRDPIYDRIRSITSDQTSFTVHKFIIEFPEPTAEKPEVTRYYKVGRPGAWTEERSFTLRSRQYVIDKGFNFLQHTDQQGFVEEEYETWRIVADFIHEDSKEESQSYDFSINTGDATQNGNRINEWLDYFNNGDSLFRDKEQMYTVGNNDLAPQFEGHLGRGEDADKMNPVNVTYFFTFEHPDEVPRSLNGVYIPSVYSFTYGNTYFLCMNSEITTTTRRDIYLEANLKNNVYRDQIRTWCINDAKKYNKKRDDSLEGDELVEWGIAFTHEAPFTILTAGQLHDYAGNLVDGVYQKREGTQRGGSHLNSEELGNYWFSRFLEEEQMNLCLCGHKHTYGNTRYLRENIDESVEHTLWKTMEPIVYSPELSPSWYNPGIPLKERQSVQLSDDSSKHYVKYVMSQATGYKLFSNKDVPADNLPWMLEYYRPAKQTIEGNLVTAAVNNPAQRLPHYILWNVGSGVEVEDPGESTSNRERIKGNSYRVYVKTLGNSEPWAYKYNRPYEHTDLAKAGGNGSSKPSNNIIVEKLFSPANKTNHPAKWVGSD